MKHCSGCIYVSNMLPPSFSMISIQSKVFLSESTQPLVTEEGVSNCAWKSWMKRLVQHKTFWTRTVVSQAWASFLCDLTSLSDFKKMKTFFHVFLFPTGAREGALLTQKKSLGERQTEEKFECVTSKKGYSFPLLLLADVFPPLTWSWC